MSGSGHARARVAHLLAAAWERQLTLVVAGAGYGKTAALRQLAATAWLDLTPADRDVTRLATRLAEQLEVAHGGGDGPPTGPDDRASLADALGVDLCSRLAERDEVLVVIDDADQLGDLDSPDTAWQLVRTLCLQAPPNVHLVLSGRRLPDIRMLVEQRRDIGRVGADDLAFTAAEVAELLGDDDSAPGTVAHDCWTLTGGWPVAVVLLRDRLARTPAPERHGVLTEIRSAGANAWLDISSGVLADEPAATIEILTLADSVGVINADLVAHLEPAGNGRDLPAEVRSLAERGLLTAASADGLYRLSPVLTGVLAASPDASRWRASAAAWLDRAGHPDLALECLDRLDAREVRGFLLDRGVALVSGGRASQVADALHAAGTDGDVRLDTLLGRARQAAGDWYGAVDAFRAAQRSTPGGRLPASVAWRFGSLLYLCGDTVGGIEALEQSMPADTAADEALVSAWRASLLWSTGDTAGAQRCAELAVDRATESGDGTARAAAHTSAALVSASQGDREANDLHYRLALVAAAEAGDTVQLARIRSNLSSRAFEEGDYGLAVEEADEALTVGRGHSVLAALALSNKADALAALGRLDEARAAASDALQRFGRTGSTLTATGHVVIAGIDRERGDLVKARLGFERAIRMSDTIDDTHTAAYARASLARLLAADDPATARATAARAVEQATDLERASALCAAAWVELVDRVPAAAIGFARAAETTALDVGDLRSLADCWEIWALAEDPVDVARLQAALARWEAMGNPIAALRTRLAIARVRGDMLGERSAAAELSGLAVAVDSGPAELLPARRSSGDELRIVTLGRFQVIRGHDVVAVTEWQSRKARDLLKLLIARRGRPIPRDAAAEALWPDEDAGALSNRLSVLLSTVRRVLDPQRQHDPDYFVSSDDNALAVRVDRVAVDVVELIDTVRQARRLTSDGQAERAEALLRQAERLYHGDFLEEDSYADWAVDCREEALDAAQSTLRQLAATDSARGDDEAALGHLRRLLERDTYDEQAWLALIRALLRLRRHGEARRQHARYARCMAELDVAPVPLAGLTDSAP
jgi:DNA-binding SARP family transcriptional activator/ATP/maltotriose-dependent transcriptional regulator MalT